MPRSRSLSAVNLPHKAYWQRPENRDRAVAMTLDDLGCIGALTMAMLCCVPVSILLASRDPAHRLPGWTLAVIVGYLVLLTGYLIWMGAVRYRPPRDQAGR